MVAAMLGVYAAGAAYVPLHRQLPTARLGQMLTAAGATTVLHDGEPANLLGNSAPAAISVADAIALGEPMDALPAHPDSLAYTMFTSGSTGAPKGVMVTRRGLDAYLAFTVDAYPLSVGEVVVSHTLPLFDLSVTSLLAPLCAGGQVRITPAEDGLDGLLDTMGELGEVGLLKLTPAHLTLLADLDVAARARVRSVVVGGESLPADAAARWQTIFPDCRIVNEYGPTETVVGCTTWTVEDAPHGYATVPIGHPIPGTHVMVLDRRLTPVALGVPGELFIGGAGVARGYRGDPRRTAELFLPDPYGPPGSRMYRSGDRVTATASCGLLFHGRLDRQIKLHGFRIEPAEIEHRLRECTDISDAVVIRARTPSGEQTLVGYVVADPGCDLAGIRAQLAGTLPWYAVPHQLVALRELPLGPSGKVEVRRLPPVRPTGGGGDQRMTTVQRLVSRVWSEVLGIPEPSLDTSFFDLGGTSFSLVKMNSRLREELGREIAIADMFDQPTIRQLAAFLESAATPEDTGQLPEPDPGQRRAALARLRSRRDGD